MNFKNVLQIAALITMPSLLIHAQTVEQDSLTHLQKINEQYNTERDLKSNLHYNPASMPDYSSSTFSALQVGYMSEDNKSYRQVLGQKITSYGLTTSSYQKVNENVSLWGKASYSSRKIKKAKWSENLDYDRISPYSIADSVGGNLDVERYHFLGGYAQKLKQFTIGLEGEYTAQLGARSRDPRNNTVTSDLLIKFGANYHFYKDLEVGAYIQGKKYTQNNEVKFASLLGYPIVYQMTGLGNYNYMFSGGSNQIKNIYEQFGYEYGGYISNNDGQDFYIAIRQGKQDMVRTSTGILSSSYDISDSQDTFTILEGGKFFGKNAHRFGLTAEYVYQKRIGTEYGYTNNNRVLELLYKEKTYKREISNYKAELFYQLTKDKYTLAFTPFANYEEYDERRLRPVNGQKWNSLTLGIAADFKTEFIKNHILSVKPYFAQKTVESKSYLFNTSLKAGIQDWVRSEYAYLSSDVTTYGVTMRYDVKMEKIPGIFAAFNLENNKILKQNNSFVGLQVGIVF